MRRLKLALANVALAVIWFFQLTFWYLWLTWYLAWYWAFSIVFWMCLAVALLAPTGLWVYQIYNWLRYGAWPPMPLDEIFIVKNLANEIDWLGLRRLYEFFVSINIGFVTLILGVFLAFLAWIIRVEVVIDCPESSFKRPRSPFQDDEAKTESNE